MDGALSVLGQRLRALPARRASVAAYLWGEAGIGKTYTCRALLRDSPCRSVTLPATLPLAELVRALPRPPRLHTWTQSALQGLQSGQTMTVPAADLLAALLGQLAPFILHLEDLHEADAAGRELTYALADALRRARGAAVLVSSRLPPTRWPENGHAVVLNRLTAPDAAAFLEHEAGAPLPAEAAAWVYERARGNPLFTLEYFRLLARQGHLWNSGDRWRWRAPAGSQLPVTVEALIERLLQDACAGPPGDVLGALALLPEADRALVRAGTDLSDAQIDRATEHLERLGILRGQDFVHPLYRELAPSVLPERCRVLARRILAAWSGAPAGAAHLVAVANLGAGEALDWLLRAADQLQAAGQPVPAARLWAGAMPYAGEPLAARLALRAAQALQEVDVPEATRLAQRAAQSPEEFVQATWLQAELLTAQGQGHRAEAMLAQLPETQRQGPAFVARVLGLRAQDNGRLLELLDQHPEALNHAAPPVVYRVGRALAYNGRAAEAEALARQLLAQPDLPAETRAMALKIHSVVAQVRADFAAMERLEHEVYELVRPSGNLRLMDAALFNRAMALGTLGRYPERTGCLAQALAVCRALGDPVAYAIAQVSFGEALSDTGAYAQAETELLEALALLEGLDPTGYLTDCQCALSALYRRWQPPHGRVLAVRFGSAALRTAQALGDQRSLCEALPAAALAHTWTGQPALALTLADRAVTLATQLNMPQLLQAALSAQGGALAALGDLRAQAVLTAAHDLARTMGDEHAAQLAALGADHLRGDVSAARCRLAWFEARNLRAGADQVRRLFPSLARPGPDEAGGPAAPHPPAGPQATEPSMRLDVLGEMRLGPPGAGGQIRGRKRRELLICLLEHRLRGRPDVPRLTLTDTLYPGVEEAQAAASLKELIYQTRAALGAGVIQTTASGYTLGPVEVDAELFLHSGDTALWRGPYLAGDEPEAGSLIADTLYGALTARAQALCAGQPTEAARLGRLLCAADPYDLTALDLTLRALRAAGNHRSLGRFYASARRSFEEVGEALPVDWATFLAAHAPA